MGFTAGFNVLLHIILQVFNSFLKHFNQNARIACNQLIESYFVRSYLSKVLNASSTLEKFLIVGRVLYYLDMCFTIWTCALLFGHKLYYLDASFTIWTCALLLGRVLYYFDVCFTIWTCDVCLIEYLCLQLTSTC